LLLFALIVPIVAAKLDAFWVSEPTFSLDTEQPVCVASGLCLRLAGDRLERNEAGELRGRGAVRSELRGPTRPHAAAMAPRFYGRGAHGAAAAAGDNAMARLPLRPL